MSSPNKGRKKLLTAKQVAQELSVSESWVRDHVTGRRRPILPHIWIGDQRGLLRFDADEIDAFYREHARNDAQ